MNNSTQWQQLPQDAGQIVDVRYAVDEFSGWLYRRTLDRSDGRVIVDRIRLRWTTKPSVYEPWNGILPATVGDWSAAE